MSRGVRRAGKRSNAMVRVRKRRRRRHLCLMIPTRFYVYIAQKKDVLLGCSYPDTIDQKRNGFERHFTLKPTSFVIST